MSSIRIQENTSGITETPGFKASSVHCDIRKKGDGRLDLALVFSKRPCSVAGVFTQNDIKAAPVQESQRILKSEGPFHGIVVNSGNANAYTGEKGREDAILMASVACHHCGVPENAFFVCSTGRIGKFLDMKPIETGIAIAAHHLSEMPQAGYNAAQAILTTDTHLKTVTGRFQWKNRTLTVSGMAKGAGMIDPNMATMLAFLATDVAIESQALQHVLVNAVNQSFNCITIDGDMSTNDTVLCLANGHASVQVTSKEPELFELFQSAVTEVCKRLASLILKDGEKVSKCVVLRVQGAKNENDAEKVARAIGRSLLVKASWAGNDPNWGRIIDAAGYARVGIIDSKIDLFYNDVAVVRKGEIIQANEPQWKTEVQSKEFSIFLDLHLGKGSFELSATDITEAYIQFNKSD